MIASLESIFNPLPRAKKEAKRAFSAPVLNWYQTLIYIFSRAERGRRKNSTLLFLVTTASCASLPREVYFLAWIFLVTQRNFLLSSSNFTQNRQYSQHYKQVSELEPRASAEIAGSKCHRIDLGKLIGTRRFSHEARATNTIHCNLSMKTNEQKKKKQKQQFTSSKTQRSTLDLVVK